MGRLLDEDIVIDVIDNLDYMPGELVDRGLSLCKDAIKSIPSAQPEEIGYEQCANAMMKMWIDEVVTDGEYNRIMDKLNKHWRGEQE